MKIEYCLGFAFWGSLVVLIRKNKPEWMAGKLNGVGGKVEPGESPAEAMSREYQEEAGVCIPVTGWTKFATMLFSGAIVHCFAFEGHSVMGSHTRTEEEVGVYRWQELGAARVICVPNLGWLMPMAYQSLQDYHSKGPVVITYP